MKYQILIENSFTPSKYQAIGDDGFFTKNEELFNKHDFEIWIQDPANFVLLQEENTIESKNNLSIKSLSEWDEKII